MTRPQGDRGHGAAGLELWGWRLPPLARGRGQAGDSASCEGLQPSSEPQPHPDESMGWENRLEGLEWGSGVVTACASVWGLGNFGGGSGSRDTGFDIKADSRRPQKICRTGGQALLSLA